MPNKCGVCSLFSPVTSPAVGPVVAMARLRALLGFTAGEQNRGGEVEAGELR